MPVVALFLLVSPSVRLFSTQAREEERHESLQRPRLANEMLEQEEEHANEVSKEKKVSVASSGARRRRRKVSPRCSRRLCHSLPLNFCFASSNFSTSLELVRPAFVTCSVPISSSTMTLSIRKRELKPRKSADGAVSGAVVFVSWVLCSPCWPRLTTKAMPWRPGQQKPRRAQPPLSPSLSKKNITKQKTTSSLAASRAPRSVRARLFAAEQKKKQQKKKGAGGAGAGGSAEKNAAKDAEDDDLFSRATLDPFSEAAPARLKRGSHTLSGPDFGVTFKEPDAAAAAADAAAENELQQQARSDAAAAARAEAFKRSAELPKQARRGAGAGGGSSASAASHVRATRALFQPQQR